MRLRMWFLGPLLVLSTWVSACDSDSEQVAGISGPSPVTSPAFVNRLDFVGAQPLVLIPRVVLRPACPSVPPLVAPFAVTIGPTGSTVVTLAEVRVGFVDTSGRRATPMILGSSELTRQFGNVQVSSFSSATFPLNFPFGCGTGTTGALDVAVRLIDSAGHTTSSTMQMQVR